MIKTILFGLLLKTGLLLLLRAASVCCSCFSSVSQPVFLYSLLAGPAGVHGRGSARHRRARLRVGPRTALLHSRGRGRRRARLEEKGMGKGGWE